MLASRSAAREACRRALPQPPASARCPGLPLLTPAGGISAYQYSTQSIGGSLSSVLCKRALPASSPVSSTPHSRGLLQWTRAPGAPAGAAAAPNRQATLTRLLLSCLLLQPPAAPTCKAVGVGCELNVDCCSPALCINAKCTAPTCKQSGAGCEESGKCCEGLTCKNAMCG